MSSNILIGIDGGGTHSTAVAAWPDGRIAAVVPGGGQNFHNDGMEIVRERLLDMISRLKEKTGTEAEAVCVGLSALDGPADEATCAAFSQGALANETLDLQSDVYIALMGLTQGQPGVIVICGTGSMLLMVDEKGNQLVSGGWGYLLNDAGSGYTLAREALLMSIDEIDGIGEKCIWTPDLLSYFGITNPRSLIDVVYAPDFTPDKLAGFARILLSYANSGDEAAFAILQRNMTRLARLAARLMDKAETVNLVGLYGGIFQHNELARNLFERALKEERPDAQLRLPEYPPELGALIHLMKKKGTLTPDTLLTLKNTYKEMQL